jgi:hypothetical protein
MQTAGNQDCASNCQILIFSQFHTEALVVTKKNNSQFSENIYMFFNAVPERRL